MTNLSKFAAQQLTKKQMNEVKGGWQCFVVTKWTEDDLQNEGYWIDVSGSNASEAVSNAGRPAGAVGLVC